MLTPESPVWMFPAARSMSEVKAIRVIQDAGTEIKWEMDEIVSVAATSEAALHDALEAIEIDFEVLSALCQ